MHLQPKGLKPKTRSLLDLLHRASPGAFTPADAAQIWSMDLRATRRLLVNLASHGWLTRIRHGLYTAVPLGAHDPTDWREDPWIIAAKVFAPCYIAGWSACEHWDLTEQIFRDIMVVTAASIRHRTTTIQGTVFRLKHLTEGKHFGARPAWRGSTKVLVSDPSRTIVDILNDPRLGGGIRHVADILSTYFASQHSNEPLLLDYIKRLGNRTVFKRLGYLLETLNIDALALLHACHHLQSSGLSPLDPSVRQKGRIVKRWNLRANVNLSPSSATS